MSRVFASLTLSIDGFMAPEAGVDEQTWMREWSALQGWVFGQRSFRELLKLGEGGLEGEDNRVIAETVARTGATILGKRMFDGGERHWPEDAPFHTPVFVLTHQVREPWVRTGGTTFHFVNDGPRAALARAREVVGARDIRVGGGAITVREFLAAGLLDELHLALVPVVLGRGLRLFEGLDRGRVGLTIQRTIHSPQVTHLFYRVNPVT